MKRISYKTSKSTQFHFSVATVSALLVGLYAGAAQAETIGGHADQISWVPTTKISTVSNHSDKITWNCVADDVIVYSHKDEISWAINTQLAQNRH